MAGTGVPEALTAAQVRTILNVADGATANATDAALRDRATHTGTQGAATITGLAAGTYTTSCWTDQARWNSENPWFELWDEQGELVRRFWPFSEPRVQSLPRAPEPGRERPCSSPPRSPTFSRFR